MYQIICKFKHTIALSFWNSSLVVQLIFTPNVLDDEHFKWVKFVILHISVLIISKLLFYGDIYEFAYEVFVPKIDYITSSDWPNSLDCTDLKINVEPAVTKNCVPLLHTHQVG